MKPNASNEVILKGGRANVGNVVRIDDQVARPAYPQTATVDHFLRYLADAGASFVPRALGRDDAGRQRLSFIDGITPTPPYQPWAFDEDLLVDVASHQRELHDLARGYVPPPEAVWAVSAGDYFPSASTDRPPHELIVCHNDLGMTNVVIEDLNQRRVAGFIDFDYCRPVDPLFDIAVAARHWVPFGELDLPAGLELDRVRRFDRFCAAHELSSGQRTTVIDLAIQFLDHARRNLKTLAAGGHRGFQALLDAGYEATNLDTVQWLRDHVEALTQSS